MMYVMALVVMAVRVGDDAVASGCTVEVCVTAVRGGSGGLRRATRWRGSLGGRGLRI